MVPHRATPHPHVVRIIKHGGVLVTTHWNVTAHLGITKFHGVQIQHQSLADVEPELAFDDETAVDDHFVVARDDGGGARASNRERFALRVFILDD